MNSAKVRAKALSGCPVNYRQQIKLENITNKREFRKLKCGEVFKISSKSVL